MCAVCIVILCNVAFHLIWARTHIILLWHFIESDKICDMRRPFTFIQTIHDGDQFTCVACVLFFSSQMCARKRREWNGRMQWEINLLIRKKHTMRQTNQKCVHTYICYWCTRTDAVYLKPQCNTTQRNITNHMHAIRNNITIEKRMSDSFCVSVLCFYLFITLFFGSSIVVAHGVCVYECACAYVTVFFFHVQLLWSHSIWFFLLFFSLSIFLSLTQM